MGEKISLPKTITGLKTDIQVDKDVLMKYLAWEDMKRVAKQCLNRAEPPGTHDGISVYELAAWTRILSTRKPDSELVFDYLNEMGYDEDADNTREESILNILCSRYGYTDVFFEDEDESFFGYDMKQLAKLILNVKKLPLENGIENHLKSFKSIIEENKDLPNGAVFRTQSVTDHTDGYYHGTLRIELRPGLSGSRRQYYLALAYGLLVFEGMEAQALAFADAVCGKKKKGLENGGKDCYIYLDPSWD